MRCFHRARDTTIRHVTSSHYPVLPYLIYNELPGVVPPIPSDLDHIPADFRILAAISESATFPFNSDVRLRLSVPSIDLVSRLFHSRSSLLATRFRAATSAGSGPQHRPRRPLRFPELCTRSLTDYHTFGSLLGTLIYQGPPRFSNRRRACCEPHSIYCKYMRGGQRTVTPG